MYNKGNNIIHYIKQMFKNDETFYACLRAMNKEYYHQTVTSADIEQFISEKSGINFRTYFSPTSLKEQLSLQKTTQGEWHFKQMLLIILQTN
jgi:hypothetical protein